jgi:hypothetical protein
LDVQFHLKTFLLSNKFNQRRREGRQITAILAIIRHGSPMEEATMMTGADAYGNDSPPKPFLPTMAM